MLTIVHVVCINQRQEKLSAFVRHICINFFVHSVRDNYNAPLSIGNDQMIILRSKLSTTVTATRLETLGV